MLKIRQMLEFFGLPRFDDPPPTPSAREGALKGQTPFNKWELFTLFKVLPRKQIQHHILEKNQNKKGIILKFQKFLYKIA